MQIYKIYINEKELLLIDRRQLALLPFGGKRSLKIHYNGTQKKLFQCIDTLEKNSPYKRLILYSEDFEGLKTDFKKLFEIIKAGGGLVMNENEEGLFIFRRGHWDLPKGKSDPDETRKQAALREVIEETGVGGLVRGPKICKTRHVYKKANGKRVLKITNWYAMSAPFQRLVPEAKEQILAAVWLSPQQFMDQKKPTYKSVLEVVESYMKSREKFKRALEIKSGNSV